MQGCKGTRLWTPFLQGLKAIPQSLGSRAKPLVPHPGTFARLLPSASTPPGFGLAQENSEAQHCVTGMTKHVICRAPLSPGEWLV